MDIFASANNQVLYNQTCQTCTILAEYFNINSTWFCSIRLLGGGGGELKAIKYFNSNRVK